MPRVSYQDKLRHDAQQAQERSRKGRDIAAGYPPPEDLGRRGGCEHDLRLYLETYHAPTFWLAWSDDHLKVITRLQTCALDGGLFALAMPRGAGKTALCVRAALWALLYGHRRFVVLVGATDEMAESMLDTIKLELQANPLLAADFPEVAYPVACLENSARKAAGQLFEGENTRIEWSARKLAFPTLPEDAWHGADLSGSVIVTRGLTGSFRGLQHTLPTGETIRPDMVLLDDPQNRESAMSPSQCNEREAIIRRDVLGLAGPGEPIAAVMPVTVIRAGDVADRFLDRDVNPAWQGERMKAVYAWPKNEARWAEYHRVRADSLRAGRRGEEATELYRLHREEMDAGALVAWPERFDRGELSAVQHVMNKQSDLGTEAFAAEYQNEPMDPDPLAAPTLTPGQVAAKVSGLARGLVPLRAVHLTAMIDVQDALLFWCVCAWESAFSGHVLDYGTWPKQGRATFTLRRATPTLADVAPGAGREGAIHAGLVRLTGELLDREWQREDGGGMRVGKALVDSGWEPELIRSFCRRSPHAAILLPSRGVGIGAAQTPMSEWQPKEGEFKGHSWFIGPTPERAGRQVRFDANGWKTFVHARLAVALGDAGSLSVFGADPAEHALFSQHVCGEAPTLVSALGRTVPEWRPRPGAENHWLDCLVGCAVAGSMLGCRLGGPAEAAPGPRKRVSWREMQKKKQEERRRRQ